LPSSPAFAAVAWFKIPGLRRDRPGDHLQSHCRARWAHSDPDGGWNGYGRPAVASVRSSTTITDVVRFLSFLASRRFGFRAEIARYAGPRIVNQNLNADRRSFPGGGFAAALAAERRTDESVELRDGREFPLARLDAVRSTGEDLGRTATRILSRSDGNCRNRRRASVALATTPSRWRWRFLPVVATFRPAAPRLNTAGISARAARGPVETIRQLGARQTHAAGPAGHCSP